MQIKRLPDGADPADFFASSSAEDGFKIGLYGTVFEPDSDLEGFAPDLSSIVRFVTMIATMVFSGFGETFKVGHSRVPTVDYVSGLVLIGLAYCFAESSTEQTERVIQVKNLLKVTLPTPVQEILSQFGDVVGTGFSFRVRDIDKLLLRILSVASRLLDGQKGAELSDLLLPYDSDDKNFHLQVAVSISLLRPEDELPVSHDKVILFLLKGVEPPGFGQLGSSELGRPLHDYLLDKNNLTLLSLLRSPLGRKLGLPDPGVKPPRFGQLPSFERLWSCVYHSRFAQARDMWMKAGFDHFYSGRFSSASLDQFRFKYDEQSFSYGGLLPESPFRYGELPLYSWFLLKDVSGWFPFNVVSRPLTVSMRVDSSNDSHGLFADAAYACEEHWRDSRPPT